MPVRWQNLIYGFRMYCFPQICSKYVPVCQAFSQGSTHVPMVTDDTFCKNPGFPVEYQNKALCRPVPALQVRYKKSEQAPPR